MTKYLLIYTDGEGYRGAIESNKPNKEEFLDNTPEAVLDKEWTIYEVNGAVTKETLVHGGNYDHVLPE